MINGAFRTLPARLALEHPSDAFVRLEAILRPQAQLPIPNLIPFAFCKACVLKGRRFVPGMHENCGASFTIVAKPQELW